MRLYFKHCPETKETCEHWETKAFAGKGDNPNFFAYGIVKIDEMAFEIWIFDPFFKGISQEFLAHRTSLKEAKDFCKLDIEERILKQQK